MYIPILDSDIYGYTGPINKNNSIFIIINTYNQSEDFYKILRIIETTVSCMILSKNIVILLFGDNNTNLSFYNKIILNITIWRSSLITKKLLLKIISINIINVNNEIINNAIYVTINKYNNLSYKTHEIINYRFRDDLKDTVFEYTLIDDLCLKLKCHDCPECNPDMIYRGLTINKRTFPFYKQYLKYKTKYNKLKNTLI
jgi:hypothetical protein